MENSEKFKQILEKYYIIEFLKLSENRNRIFLTPRKVSCLCPRKIFFTKIIMTNEPNIILSDNLVFFSEDVSSQFPLVIYCGAYDNFKYYMNEIIPDRL